MQIVIDEYTQFILEIERTHKDAKNWDDKWCAVTLRVKNAYLDYHTFNNEILLESEIEHLIKSFNKLVKGELKEEEHIEFIEPDLEFTLFPESSLVDMRINFFENGALSANYYNLCLDVTEIKKILTYMNSVIPTVDDIESINNEEKKYCYVQVKYDDYNGEKTYAYILDKDDEDAQIGDTVIVDRAGYRTRGKIVEKEFYTIDNVPFPLSRTKRILEVLKTPEDFDKYDLGCNKKYKCPCCGNYTLSEVDSFEVCPVCYWEDDNLQRLSPELEGGANKVNLINARKNYKKFNACEESFIKNVRFPKLEETIYADEYKSEDDIIDVLYTGSIEELKYIIQQFKIEYAFSKEIPEYSISIGLFGTMIRGKRNMNEEYSCMKLLGYEFSYKNLIQKCPSCGEQLVDIVYGMPSSILFEKSNRQEVFLGGCCIIEDMEQPIYHCYNCNKHYYKDLTEDENIEN